MEIPGANIVSSIAGAAEAKAREAAAKLRAKRHEATNESPYGREAAAETELSQAARRAAGNDQEEAHEDREEHMGQNTRPNGPARPRLDLEG